MNREALILGEVGSQLDDKLTHSWDHWLDKRLGASRVSRAFHWAQARHAAARTQSDPGSLIYTIRTTNKVFFDQCLKKAAHNTNPEMEMLEIWMWFLKANLAGQFHFSQVHPIAMNERSQYRRVPVQITTSKAGDATGVSACQATSALECPRRPDDGRLLSFYVAKLGTREL